MSRKIFAIIVSLICVLALVPSVAFAVPMWNDSTFLAKSYEPSIMTWQSDSYVTYSGGVYTHTDAFITDRSAYALPSGGRIRFHNIGYDQSGSAIDFEIYGSNTSQLSIFLGDVDGGAISVGDAFEFRVGSTVQGVYSQGNLRLSMYKAGTNMLANAKLAFGIYDIDINWYDVAETFTLNSNNATLYGFNGSRLGWSGRSCYAATYLGTVGYARDAACYVTVDAAQVDTAFSGLSCGMNYSFQGVNITPDSPRKSSDNAW